jgi:Zn-dependent M28 family amino/carboxypeptidase
LTASVVGRIGTLGVAVATALGIGAASVAAQSGTNASQRTDLPIKHAPRPTSGAITPEDLMTRLYIFADDSMQGREAGTPGHVRGTEYIVRELTRLGAKPAGENGTFYQNVPTMVTRLDMEHATLRSGVMSFRPGIDFQPFPGVLGLYFPSKGSATNAPVVFGGRLMAPSAISADSVKGKVVLLLPPLGRDGQPAFQVWAARDQIESYHDAAALVVVSLEITPPPILGYLTQSQMELGGDVSAPELSKSPPVIVVTGAVAQQLLGGDADAASVGAPGKNASFEFAIARTPPSSPTRNVVALIEGSDPRMKGQMVALSAHSDHIGVADEVADHDSLRLADLIARPMGVESPDRDLNAAEQARLTAALDSIRKVRPARRDSISNGADDDGSGSMGLLEIAEYFMNQPQKPKRSLLFVWNVAEEKGLFGSEWFTEHPTVPRDSIVADINIDMIGRGAAYDIENGGPDYLQLLGSRRLSTEYGNWVEEVNRRPEFNFRLDYQFDAPGHPQQYYCRSDHWNFARWSIPTVFFSTGSHVDYHMVTDEPQYIDYPHYAKVVQFVAALAADIGGRPERPKVDKARPDPHGACQQ